MVNILFLAMEFIIPLIQIHFSIHSKPFHGMKSIWHLDRHFMVFSYRQEGKFPQKEIACKSGFDIQLNHLKQL